MTSEQSLRPFVEARGFTWAHHLQMCALVGRQGELWFRRCLGPTPPRDPEAADVQRWVFHCLLPALRRAAVGMPLPADLQPETPA